MCLAIVFGSPKQKKNNDQNNCGLSTIIHKSEGRTGMNDLEIAGEIWKPIPDPIYKEWYEVSNMGRVRRIKTQKILNQRATNVALNGITPLEKKTIMTTFSVPLMVAKVFLPNPNNLERVAQIDKSKGFEVSNLKWIEGKLQNQLPILKSVNVITDPELIALWQELFPD